MISYLESKFKGICIKVAFRSAKIRSFAKRETTLYSMTPFGPAPNVARLSNWNMSGKAPAADFAG
jgi:hypothetical protein